MRNELALAQLNVMRHRLTKQQYRTLKGQILAGDSTGAMRGLATILMREKRR